MPNEKEELRNKFVPRILRLEFSFVMVSRSSVTLFSPIFQIPSSTVPSFFPSPPDLERSRSANLEPHLPQRRHQSTRCDGHQGQWCSPSGFSAVSLPPTNLVVFF